jgi:RNA polymerase sigma-70 factor (ECF subfamily)
MPDDDLSTTSVTLLEQIRADPRDQAAWSDFVARYGPKIVRWSRGWGLQESDAQDVTQDVLLKLNGLMATFVYDPSGSFRAWLKTLTHHAWRDLVDERRRAGLARVGDRMIEFLESPQAGQGLAEQLDEEFRLELIDRAMARVRRRVAAHTWDAFRLTALEGLTGAAAAARLAMKITRVYGAKSEVTRRIQEEVRRLEGDDPEDSTRRALGSPRGD